MCEKFRAQTRAHSPSSSSLHHMNKTRNEHQSENRRSQTSKRVRGAPPSQPSGQRWHVKKQPWNSFHSLYIRTTKKQAQRTWLRWRTRPAPFTTPFSPSSAELALLRPDTNYLQQAGSRIQPLLVQEMFNFKIFKPNVTVSGWPEISSRPSASNLDQKFRYLFSFHSFLCLN